MQLYYAVDQPKVGEGLTEKKLHIFNIFTDTRHLLILVAMTELCKKL